MGLQSFPLDTRKNGCLTEATPSLHNQKEKPRKARSLQSAGTASNEQRREKANRNNREEMKK